MTGLGVVRACVLKAGGNEGEYMLPQKQNKEPGRIRSQMVAMCAKIWLGLAHILPDADLV